MSVEQFIDKIAGKGLLDEALLQRLRRDATAAGNQWNPQDVIKFLVEQGHLTRFQGKNLLKELQVSEPAAHESLDLAASESIDGLSIGVVGDDDEDDDDSLDPANKKRKTETLRPGDEIEYYSIMAVQGRKGDLHEAKIIAVDPKENPVLILDSGDVLPKDHFIRRVKKIHRGKLIDCDNANYQQIDYFRLSKASIEGFDSSKAHTAAFAKEAKRVGGIIRRNMTKFQEKAQAEGFAPMDMMNRYKGTNFDSNIGSAATSNKEKKKKAGLSPIKERWGRSHSGDVLTPSTSHSSRKKKSTHQSSQSSALSESSKSDSEEEQPRVAVVVQHW
mgnify:CR=1 FL=1